MTEQSTAENGSSALDALFWRDEILQVMFWMRGEGLGETCTPESLAIFLTTDPASLLQHLDRMVEENYLLKADGRGYCLTDLGRREGGHLFARDFADLTHQAHGECNNPNCACQTQGPQACASRTGQSRH